MEALILLLLILSSFIMFALIGQSLFALFNSNDALTSEHIQEFEVSLKLEKKITREETDPLSLAALSSPATLPIFFAWSADQKYALVFEGKVAIAVNKDLYESASLGVSFPIIKKNIRRYYSRNVFYRPWLINFFLKDIYPAESQEEITKYSLK